MGSTAGMHLTRLLTVVLFGLLLVGWGGFAMPVAATAAISHQVVTTGADAATDCDTQAEHREHGGHQDYDQDHSKLTHNGCCVMACAMSALAPAQLQIAPIEWAAACLQFGDDTLRDRTVSPLRRPPRPVA